jgi:cell wall-associated NlpC family hydrolase
MGKSEALKSVIFAASVAFLISVPASVAQAQTEEGVAGIAISLDNIDKETEDYITEIYKTEILSPLEDKGVSNATTFVNIRSKPSTDSEIVGKLYRGCAADILERLEGDWVKIKSGDVEGYIASNYLVTGKDAEKMADEYATKYATVCNTPTLRVREEQNTDSKTLELIPEGETYIVLKEYDDWAEILLGSDDEGNDFTGFVSKNYVTIEIDFKEAISIEEEQRQIKLQEEAERAEEERRQKLAEAEARRKAEEEAEKKEAQAAKDNDEKESKPSTKSSGSLSGLRSDIVSYARKFVGGPYLWSGTSLTGGADCSGFVWRIYRDFGYSIPRTSYDQSRGAGIRVDLDDRQPGDLIFYANSSGTVNHVAMYIGNDQIVQAANSRQGIIISKYNYRNVVGIRRVVY